MSSNGDRPSPDSLICEALPHGPMSLWDVMLNFHLVDVMHALWMLDFYERATVYAAPKPTTLPKDHPPGLLNLASLAGPLNELGGIKKISDMDVGHAKEIIEAVTKIANQLDLKTAKHRLAHFELALRYDISEVDYKSEIKVLRDALKHDLSHRHFYHYPEAKVEVLRKFFPQWKDISTAFLSAKSEALAATDCYAMGQNTASVFHIMRVAEFGLRALADERKIQLPRKKPVAWGQWQELITALTTEATKIGLKARAGTAKDNALAFYSGSISDLNAFKDEYRNQVMHVRKEYDEHQALRALTKVHVFMERISEKMNHKHQRIKWGLKFAKA